MENRNEKLYYILFIMYFKFFRLTFDLGRKEYNIEIGYEIEDLDWFGMYFIFFESFWK